MKRLAIIRPLPLTGANLNASGGWTSTTNLLTPNPKEIATVAGAGQTLDIDLGSVQSIDTLYLGFANAPGTVDVTYGAASYTTSAWPEQLAYRSASTLPNDSRSHWFSLIAAPVNARYIRITGSFGGGFTIGVLAVGLSFQAFWGHEYGAGRPVEDTSVVERLLGGAFGIYEGAIVGGYQWTFGDLQPDEVQALYALVRTLGQSRTCLVVEDVDYTAGFNERVHWSLFNRLEPYERLNPADSRWAFKVWDWA